MDGHISMVQHKATPPLLLTATDLAPRPKARDRLCRNVQYHDKYEDVKTICNLSVCVNWPYEPFDTLISISGSEYVVNPVFITHVRNLDNWTLGQSFLDAYVMTLVQERDTY